jgi:hypothetical protein
VIAVAAVAVACGAPARTRVEMQSTANEAAASTALAPGLRSTSTAPDPYRMTIAMTAETVEALSASGFSLYGFKAVGSSDLAGVPLVWFVTRRYSLSTVVTWRGEYQAYTATHSAAPSVSVDAAASYDIVPGQVLEVVHSTGTGAVVSGGTPGAISIHNETTTPFICGISQRDADGVAPVAAFPLYGNGLQVVVPLEQVLLVFSTARFAPGTPVTASPGLGVLVALSGTDERQVSYDINAGWSWGDAPWAREVPAGSDLVPLLIVSAMP